MEWEVSFSKLDGASERVDMAEFVNFFHTSLHDHTARDTVTALVLMNSMMHVTSLISRFSAHIINYLGRGSTSVGLFTEARTMQRFRV